MRKIFVMAVFACFAAMNVNAQSEVTESKNEKMLRLTKAADENPADWKAQQDILCQLPPTPSIPTAFRAPIPGACS